ncbi:ankyrin repeat domain-containing protein [Gloeobacter violaceus]
MVDQKLILAIQRAEIAQIRRLLADGVSPNGPTVAPLFGTRPQTLPLIEAIRCRQKEIVHLLLEAGADPQASEYSGATPLAMAVHLNFQEAVQFLLAKGANAETDRHLRSPNALVQAIRIGDSHAVRRQLEDGASAEGQAGLLKALVRPEAVPLVEAVRGGQQEIVRLLLEAGANPNAADKRGALPLKLAVHLGSEPIVRLLLEHGADPNKRASGETTSALQHAAFYGHVELVRVLLEHGGNPAAVLQTKSLFRIRGPILQMLIDAGGEAPEEILQMLREGSALP